MLEHYLIEHCSPTLASLKTGNLFRIPYESKQALEEQIHAYSNYLADKGVSLSVLKRERKNVLVYVYRRKRLLADLKQEGISAFLTQLGYCCKTPEDAIQFLTQRLSNCTGFPHEIGLFLSYPLADVLGFIAHEGKHCKCAGCWKVYCNEQDALKLFARFKKCRHVYQRLWNQGRSILQLTVAA